MGGISRSAGLTSVETSPCCPLFFSSLALAAFLRAKKPPGFASATLVAFLSELGLESTILSNEDAPRGRGKDENLSEDERVG